MQQWLAQATTRRLGRYYERLWQFAVTHAPGVELVAANLPIRVGGHTLGELDMLLRDRDGVHHLELAIKLYLGPQHGDGHDPAHWLGPGSTIGWTANLRISASISYRCPAALNAATFWRVWTFSISVRTCGWAATCCIRGPAKRSPRPARIRCTYAAAGCINAIGQRYPSTPRRVLAALAAACLAGPCALRPRRDLA